MIITKNNINDIYKSKRASIELMQLKGYKLIKELFVDSSGFGQDDELAYTQSQFIKEVENILTVNDKVYSTITNAGQFQVYIGIFKKISKPIAKKIAGNTYKVETDNDNYILYHNTKIMIYNRDFVILNNGGYFTKSTKDRFNQYLPSGVSIYQKDYNWYIKDNRDNTTKEFINNIQIAS